MSPSPFARTVLAERTGEVGISELFASAYSKHSQQSMLFRLMSAESSRRETLGRGNVPALASFFNGAATADGGKTGNQAVVAAALLSAGVLGRSLLVLHGLLALRRTIVLALGRRILSLRRAIALKMKMISLLRRE